jgi:hypothetical protein
MRRLLLFLVLFAFGPAAFAEATAGQASAAPRDLGLGLIYYRVHALPADLPTDEAIRHHACVLDLRYVRGNAADAATLNGWLKFHASAATPVLLLANAETSSALLTPFASADAIAGLVILGPAAPDFAPDIAINVSPAADRRAYRALDSGTPIDSLVTEVLAKTRNDEAMLAREHLPDSALSNLGGDNAETAAADKHPRQLIDRVLQRAVQLHRTLIALKRIGSG